MNFRVFLASLTVLLAVAGGASARGTLDSILPGIRAQHPGRLSDAEPWTDSEGRTHYRIKWMTPEGRILFFNADADSGRYTDSNGGDVGRQWRGDRRGGDDQPAGDDNGGNRSHWNDDGGDDNRSGGGDWRARHGGADTGGDWRDRQHGGETGNGERQRGQGDWNRGGNGGGDRGGWHSGGDNGGGGHHHHGDN